MEQNTNEGGHEMPPVIIDIAAEVVEQTPVESVQESAPNEERGLIHTKPEDRGIVRSEEMNKEKEPEVTEIFAHRIRRTKRERPINFTQNTTRPPYEPADNPSKDERRDKEEKPSEKKSEKKEQDRSRPKAKPEQKSEGKANPKEEVRDNPDSLREEAMAGIFPKKEEVPNKSEGKSVEQKANAEELVRQIERAEREYAGKVQLAEDAYKIACTRITIDLETESKMQSTGLSTTPARTEAVMDTDRVQRTKQASEIRDRSIALAKETRDSLVTLYKSRLSVVDFQR